MDNNKNIWIFVFLKTKWLNINKKLSDTIIQQRSEYPSPARRHSNIKGAGARMSISLSIDAAKWISILCMHRCTHQRRAPCNVALALPARVLVCLRLFSRGWYSGAWSLFVHYLRVSRSCRQKCEERLASGTKFLRARTGSLEYATC
jgi:hypothetical protein